MPVRYAASLVTLSLFGAGAGAARADVIVDAFSQVCQPAKNDQAAALKIADAAGWKPAPNAAQAQAFASAAMPGSSVDVRIKSVPTGQLALTTMHVGQKGMVIDACGIVGATSDLANLEKAVAELAALPPTPAANHPEVMTYLFQDLPSGHRALTGAVPPDVFKQGGLVSIAVTNKDGQVTVAGTTIKVATP